MSSEAPSSEAQSFEAQPRQAESRQAMSSTRLRVVVAVLSSAALLTIVLAAMYQDDDKLRDQVLVTGGSASGQADGGSDNSAEAADEFATGSPIEGWLPASGEASACLETIGVDLIPGYGATLVINGTPIAPEEMNVVLDENGEIANQVTASRSLGQYTFEPSAGCPNGRWIRPTNNVLEACVYRLSDTTRRCVIRPQHSFDAL